MKSQIVKTALIFSLLAFALPTLAAGNGYIKLPDIDGESKRSKPAATQPAKIESNQEAKPTGLLVPGVQKIRGASSRSEAKKESTKGGNVETEFKVEKGEK